MYSSGYKEGKELCGPYSVPYSVCYPLFLSLFLSLVLDLDSIAASTSWKELPLLCWVASFSCWISVGDTSWVCFEHSHVVGAKGTFM